MYTKTNFQIKEKSFKERIFGVIKDNSEIGTSYNLCPIIYHTYILFVQIGKFVDLKSLGPQTTTFIIHFFLLLNMVKIITLF